MNRLLPLVALAAFLPLRGSAETTLGAAITAVPYTITKPGVYHFTKNLGWTSSTNDAIKIEATDVVIDLNGYELVATVPGNTANGVECTDESRVTIKDGTIRGFQVGLLMLGSDYVRLEDLLITNSIETGVSLVGNHCDITGNRISDTGNTVNTSTLYSIGISLTGTYGTVTNNDIQNTFESDNTNRFADGIRLRGCSTIVVSGNRVLDVEPSAPTKAISTGIEADPNSPSVNLVFLGNVVVTAGTGIDLSGDTSGGDYGDNLASDVGTGYNTGGTSMVNIGGNN